ncbi:MAG TPA: hypothetical protein G4O13_00040 [Dehalococcoidia bacterium]|nr:hypothetical protein [Dehalococcoidia bacterium]
MLEQVRDVMIIICAFLVIASTITFTVVTILIFRKVSPTLDSAKGFVSDIQSISSVVSGKMVRPAMKGAIFAAGLRKALVTLSKHSHRKEKNDDNRK